MSRIPYRCVYFHHLSEAGIPVMSHFLLLPAHPRYHVSILPIAEPRLKISIDYYHIAVFICSALSLREQETGQAASGTPLHFSKFSSRANTAFLDVHSLLWWTRRPERAERRGAGERGEEKEMVKEEIGTMWKRGDDEEKQKEKETGR